MLLLEQLVASCRPLKVILHMLYAGHDRSSNYLVVFPAILIQFSDPT